MNHPVFGSKAILAGIQQAARDNPPPVQHRIKVGYRVNRDVTENTMLPRIYRAQCACGWQAPNDTKLRYAAVTAGAKHMDEVTP